VSQPAPAKKLRPLRDEITDLPNLITLARIALIPVVLLCIDNYSPRLSALSCFVFLIAAASDALDGYLARRMGLITVVGKFLDPLAGKLIVLSTLIMLMERGRVPGWLVVVLMSREIAVTGLRAIASSEGLVIAAGAGGKVKTALQLVGISFLLVHFSYDILLFDYSLDFHQVGIYLLYVSLVMSVISAVEYFRFFVEAASKVAGEQAEQGITRAGVRTRLRRRRAKMRALRRSFRRDAKRRRRAKAVEKATQKQKRKRPKAGRMARKRPPRRRRKGGDDSDQD
jgi:CDP-diacylglycerol--glycerol-3-phosphate 3-phosphatidyltransferase